MRWRAAVAVLAASLGASSAAAGETRTLAPGAASPPASIDQLAWLQGEWRGEGLGGTSIETYSAPTGGQITGHFVQANADGVVFTELMHALTRGPSIAWRLRHFNPDLTAWEEKNEVVRFPLVAVERDAFFFDGLTIRRDGQDGMVAAVRIGNKDGTSREAVFRYRRVS